MMIELAGSALTGPMGGLLGLNATCCGAHHRSSTPHHLPQSKRTTRDIRHTAEAARRPSAEAPEAGRRAALHRWEQVWERRLRIGRAAAVGALAAGALLAAGPLVGSADARTPLTQEERVSVELFKDNTPSVVFITNLAVR